MRTDLLEVVNAPLCAHISEAQLISNPIVNLMSKITSGSQLASHASIQQSIDEHALPDWRWGGGRGYPSAQLAASNFSLHGVGIPLQLLKLLTALKDHCRVFIAYHLTVVPPTRTPRTFSHTRSSIGAL